MIISETIVRQTCDVPNRYAQTRKGEIKRMKKANIIIRIVFGFLSTAALTSFILFASNIYSADQAASHSAAQADSTAADQASLAKESSLNTKDENLSIGMSERHMLFQPQDTSPSQAADSLPSDQDMESVDNPNPSDQDTDSTNNPNPSGQEEITSDKTSDNTISNDTKKQQHKKSNKKSKRFHTVTEDYFSDALFIGDSRTVGMLQSHLLSNAAYYAKTGIGIGSILSERIVNEGGRMISVSDALHLHTFGKIYIMIGINDISSGDTEWFTQQYQAILDTIHSTQPDAVVYIQGNIPMSYGKQDPNGALNNKNLSLRNEASRALADQKTIFYLDIDKIYADENGHLQSCYTSDGLHVIPDYYTLWVDYLLHHAIV